MKVARRGSIARRSRAQATLVAFVCVLIVQTISAQAPSWTGTWRLDLSRSEFIPGPAPYVRATRRVELFDGGIRIVEDLVRVRGGITHLEWTGKLDGRDYRVHGVDLFVTYAYRNVDPVTLEGVVKLDGAVVSTSRETFSADAGMITIVTRGARLLNTMRFVRVP